LYSNDLSFHFKNEQEKKLISQTKNVSTFSSLKIKELEKSDFLIIFFFTLMV
jgi:hypothetical protein